MRVLLITSMVVLAVACCSSSPIDHTRKLISRPTIKEMFRDRRSAQVKGHNVLYVKGGSHGHPESNLRKGEYMCGGKICKLQPGEVPKGCKDHICQYPLPLSPL